ncbi:MAG TPA: response regulator [Bacteroidales bacterium]|nr:response regulator [Bacteroidales bacterium]
MNTDINILYVDDEFLNLQIFKFNFGKKFNVLVADSGDEGLRILADNASISIVISDMKMPNMSGLEFIEIAKRMYPSICFYILTGFGMNEEIQKAMDEKLINRYFSKPLNLPLIESEILNATGQNR